jgi:hypothetical protein
MATDGLVMLSPTQLIQNVARHLLFYNAYIIKQLPHALQARIEPTTFLSAFSINLDGQRISVGPWATAPTGYCRPPPGNSSDRPDNDVEEDRSLDIDANMTEADRAAHQLRIDYLSDWATHSANCGKFMGCGQELVEAINEDMPEYKKRKAVTKQCEMLC